MSASGRGRDQRLLIVALFGAGALADGFAGWGLGLAVFAPLWLASDRSSR